MKGSNLGAMLGNPNQNKGIKYGRDVREPKIKKEGIESRRDAREPRTKQRDQIRMRCWRTRNKRKGSNLRAMLEDPKQNKGIERVQRRKERAMTQSKASIPCQKPTTAHKVKVTKLEIL